MPSDITRSDYPDKPSNSTQSGGAVGNVGGGPDKPLIRPEYPTTPTAPARPQGDVANVGGPKAEQPVVRSQ